MNNEYFLIGFRTTVGKQDYEVIDKIVNTTKANAEKEFKARNNFKKLLYKHDLTIAKAEKWIQ